MQWWEAQQIVSTSASTVDQLLDALTGLDGHLGSYTRERWTKHPNAPKALARLDTATPAQRAGALVFIERPDLLQGTLDDARTAKDKRAFALLARTCLPLDAAAIDQIMRVDTAAVLIALAERSDTTHEQRLVIANDKRKTVRTAFAAHAVDPEALRQMIATSMADGDESSVGAFIAAAPWQRDDLDASVRRQLESMAANAVLAIDPGRGFGPIRSFIFKASPDGLLMLWQFAEQLGFAFSDQDFRAFLQTEKTPSEIVEQIAVLPGLPDIRMLAIRHPNAPTDAAARSAQMGTDIFQVQLSRDTLERILTICSELERSQISAQLEAVDLDAAPTIVDTTPSPSAIGDLL